MADRRARIFVLAGVNGSGKSSVGGAAFRRSGTEYFDPDEATRRILAANPQTTEADANAAAWAQGKRMLERAIASRLDFAFETTLGGETIKDLLLGACAAGIEVAIWYAGLATPELNIERVRARVAAGGHDIPEDAIRRRYESSRRHLIELLPYLAELRVHENSAPADPLPRPELLLHMRGGKVVSHADLATVPKWAKPILAAALRAVPPAKRKLSLPPKPRRRR